MPADRTSFSPLASSRTAPLAAIAALCALAACKGPTAGGIAALGPDPLVEKSDIATVGWSIDPDDHVGVALDGHDGKPLGKKVTGTLVYKTPSGIVKTVPLVPDNSGDKLVATGPKFEPGLTEVDYTLDVDGRPLASTLYVPPGGTPAIVAEAKVRPPDAPAVEAKRGPHGGVIQLVGP
ncbi:MAG TPA: hypothetical protein VGY54_28485, partial [Polyangiaceae bacterium]|nr:hypothetical protein [Polyangiaceae bacterium]